MDSDNDSYHSESEFYYPDEENVLQETSNARARCETASVTKINTNISYKVISHISVLSTALGYSFSQYGPPSRQITYIYCPSAKRTRMHFRRKPTLT